MKLLIFLLAGALAAQPRLVPPPAGPESGMANFATAPDGTVYLSWIDPTKTGHALRFSTWQGQRWSAPETAAAGANWFVNWADFPSISVQPSGALLAHWLTRAPGAGTFGYGIRLARRAAPGQPWKEFYGISLHETQDYAGFLSFTPGGAVFLAPPPDSKPAHGGHEHRKTLHFLQIEPNGNVASDREIDADVCSCCQTALVQTGNGFLAAYRDHQPGEIRDISVIRYVNGAWTAPRTLHPDGWKINGCPTDGPSIATNRNGQLGIVWLTRANDRPRVQLALSADSGESFAKPIRIDDGNPLGRANIARLDDQSYLIVWLEKTNTENVAVRLRRVSINGTASPAVTVATAPNSRATGFPKVAVAGNQILVAWRNGNIRIAALSVPLLMPKGTN